MKTLKLRKLRFNLIEVVLALGVAAFGMTAVLAMLPPSFNANKTAAKDALANEIAAKLITWMDVYSRNIAQNYGYNSAKWYSNMSFFATALPTKSQYEDIKLVKNDGSKVINVTPFANRNGNPFQNLYMSNTQKALYYYVENPPDDINDLEPDDAAAKILVWMEPMKNVHSWDPANKDATKAVIPLDGNAGERPAIRFNIIVSWPADDVKYQEQQHRFFTYEIAMPAKR